MKYNFSGYFFKNKLIKKRLSGLSRTSVNNFFLTHESPNSLKAIKDFFLSIGVNCTGYRLPQNQTIEVPTPFIAQLNNPKEFVIVNNISKKTYKVITSNEVRKEYHEEDFHSRWSGAILSLDLSRTLIPSTRWNKKTLPFWEMIFGLVLTILLILPLLFLNTRENHDLLPQQILISIGLCSSLILIRIYYDKSGLLENKICKVNSRFNCKNILSSNLFLRWGATALPSLGVFFFSSLYTLQFLTWEAYTLVGFICLLASPVSIYLLAYQVIATKKICPFCTLVHLVILVCATLFWAKWRGNNPVLFSNAITILSIAILLAFCITLIFNLYYSNEKLQKEIIALQTITHKQNVINSLLRSTPKEILTENTPVFKSREGSPEIIFVLSLSCPNCLNALLEYRHILDTMPKLGMGIIFSVYSHNVDAVGGFIQCIEMNYENNDTPWLDLLTQWFTNPRFKEQNLNKEYSHERLQHYLTWSSNNGLTASPSIIINDKVWPYELSISDLSDYLRSNF